MGFHKVNPKEEIAKAIKKNPELATEIEKASEEYELIKLRDKATKMTLMCPKCRKEANYVKEEDIEKLGFYAFNCTCGDEFMAPKQNPDIKVVE